MNYDLAKKLKDAGFPQTADATDGDTVIDDVYFPRLSELIEACGDKFGSLQRNTDGWYCFNYSREIMSHYGSTTEESVANLWLELNKQDI